MADAGLCLCLLFTFGGVVIEIRMLGVLRVLSFSLKNYPLSVKRQPQRFLIFR